MATTIRQLREACGLSQQALAERLCVSADAVRYWEEVDIASYALPDWIRRNLPSMERGPRDGAYVRLYSQADGPLLAVAGLIALGVRADQLNADLTPPDRIVLDRALAWETAPAQLGQPEAEYTITFKPHVLVLTRLGSTPQPPEPKPTRRALSLAHNGRSTSI